MIRVFWSAAGAARAGVARNRPASASPAAPEAAIKNVRRRIGDGLYAVLWIGYRSKAQTLL